MTNKQWKALQHDILDRRGLKWEWARIDEDVDSTSNKKEIGCLWLMM